MDGFPSGQRGQTVNLLQIASVVRIHLHPFKESFAICRAFFVTQILVFRDECILSSKKCCLGEEILRESEGTARMMCIESRGRY